MNELGPIKIGDHVLVYRVTEVEKDGSFAEGTLRRTVRRRDIEPMHAVVTGMKRLRTGHAELKDVQYDVVTDDGLGPSEEVPVFVGEGDEIVYTVRTGWLNRELYVSPRDMQVIDEPPGTPPLRGKLHKLGPRPKRG